MSNPRSKTKKVSRQINDDCSSLVNNSKTDEPCPTTTSRKSPPFIWFFDFEVCHRAKFEAFGPKDQRQQVDLPKVLRQVEPKGHQLQEAKVRSIQRLATKETTRIRNYYFLRLWSNKK